jgi:hypothetical protein
VVQALNIAVCIVNHFGVKRFQIPDPMQEVGLPGGAGV